MSTPEARRLELVAQLRDLRAAAGQSGNALSAKVGWAQSKVSRLENSKQPFTDSDIAIWCQALGVAESVTAALLEELRDIRLEESRWQRRLRTGNEPVVTVGAQREGNATTIRVFELAVIPGLVQTADYARHIFHSVAELHRSPSDIEQAVRARIQRQEVLYDSTKHIDILTTEWVLRSSTCPASVMAGQIDRLLAVLGLGTIRFGVLPLDARIPAVAMNGFWMFDDTVVAETVNAEITIREPEDVDLHVRLLDGLWTVAAEGDDARAILLECARRWAERRDG